MDTTPAGNKEMNLSTDGFRLKEHQSFSEVSINTCKNYSRGRCIRGRQNARNGNVDKWQYGKLTAQLLPKRLDVKFRFKNLSFFFVNNVSLFLVFGF